MKLVPWFPRRFAPATLAVAVLSLSPDVPARAAVAAPSPAPVPAPVRETASTVEALVAEALERSPALAAVRASVAAARERIAPAGTLPDPMLRLSYENDGASLSLGTEAMTRLSVMAEQPILWPGKLSLAARIAEADADVAEAAIARLGLGVEAQTRRAAARLLEARAAGELTRELSENWDRIESVARSRYAAGLGAQQDVFRAQAERTRLLQQLRRDEGAVHAAEAELRRLLLREPGTPVELEERLHETRPEPPDADVELARAEAESPEIEVARRAAEREALAIDLARRDRMPDLVASVGYMNRGSLPMMWAVGLGVTVPLFSGRKQEPRLREAQARLAAVRAAEADVRLRLRARTEAQLALLAQLAEEARLDREALLVQDRMAVEAALASYASGSVPFVTVLEAISTEFADRRAALGRLAAFLVAEADLYERSLDGAPMAAASALPSAPAPPAAMNAAGGM
ncbi:MAG: TolC family protein [Thermoanaerobaculia bacterium]|jgi:outer membrane protein TolC|nr:TolC family protein [Thermoanaerobaculia bacterium]